MANDRSVTFTDEARTDLLDIWDFIRADRSETMADEVLTRIVGACDVLADHPQLGRRRPDIDPDARMLVIQRWLALYRVMPNGAQVVRVVDGARELSRITFGG